jgi:hypothetical protein
MQHNKGKVSIVLWRGWLELGSRGANFGGLLRGLWSELVLNTKPQSTEATPTLPKLPLVFYLPLQLSPRLPSLVGYASKVTTHLWRWKNSTHLPDTRVNPPPHPPSSTKTQGKHQIYREEIESENSRNSISCLFRKAPNNSIDWKRRKTIITQFTSFFPHLRQQLSLSGFISSSGKVRVHLRNSEKLSTDWEEEGRWKMRFHRAGKLKNFSPFC